MSDAMDMIFFALDVQLAAHAKRLGRLETKVGFDWLPSKEPSLSARVASLEAASGLPLTHRIRDVVQECDTKLGERLAALESTFAAPAAGAPLSPGAATVQGDASYSHGEQAQQDDSARRNASLARSMDDRSSGAVGAKEGSIPRVARIEEASQGVARSASNLTPSPASPAPEIPSWVPGAQELASLTPNRPGTDAWWTCFCIDLRRLIAERYEAGVLLSDAEKADMGVRLVSAALRSRKLDDWQIVGILRASWPGVLRALGHALEERP